MPPLCYYFFLRQCLVGHSSPLINDQGFWLRLRYHVISRVRFLGPAVPFFSLSVLGRQQIHQSVNHPLAASQCFWRYLDLSGPWSTSCISTIYLSLYAVAPLPRRGQETPYFSSPNPYTLVCYVQGELRTLGRWWLSWSMPFSATGSNTLPRKFSLSSSTSSFVSHAISIKFSEKNLEFQ